MVDFMRKRVIALEAVILSATRRLWLLWGSLILDTSREPGATLEGTGPPLLRNRNHLLVAVHHRPVYSRSAP